MGVHGDTRKLSTVYKKDMALQARTAVPYSQHNCPLDKCMHVTSVRFTARTPQISTWLPCTKEADKCERDL